MVKVLTLLNASLFLVSTALLVWLMTGTPKPTAAEAESTPIIYQPQLLLLISE